MSKSACMWLGFSLTLASVGAVAQTVTGSGTANTVPVFTGASTVGNSPISVSGSNVGIGLGTAQPTSLFQVGGAVNNIQGGPGPYASTDGWIGGYVGSNLGWNGSSWVTGGDGAHNGGSVLWGDASAGWNFITVPSNGAAAQTIPDTAIQSFNRMRITGTGNIGIGTTNPNATLQVNGGAQWSASNYGANLVLSGGRNNALGFLDSQGNNPWAIANELYGGSGQNALVFAAMPPLGDTSDLQTRILTLLPSGQVGIGTPKPSQALEVNGYIQTDAGIYFPGNSTPQTQPYTGVTCGGDYAESVDVTGDRKNYAPGDVLVIDPDHDGKFLKSVEPYSTAVTGIYSTKPGTLGRRQTGPQSPDEVPMAMIGIVPTKVNAENGPIHRGDLLVTSSTIGYAMKGTDRSRLTGAVIGKALGNLESGKGVIEVVVTLQ